jgi:hypothetical protein
LITGIANISASELHIQAGGTTVVMDSDGIKATTGGKVTSAPTQEHEPSQATVTDAGADAVLADANQSGQG